MKHEKLMNARKSRGFTQNQMAEKIAMEQTTYSRKEIGKSLITDDEWNNFAKALNVPVEEIKDTVTPLSIKNENCTFSDSAVGIQYVNIPQNVFDIIIKYNAKLEEENLSMKKQLEKV
jgi:transcriptional regulator with XRE-family HTH domain